MRYGKLIWFLMFLVFASACNLHQSAKAQDESPSQAAVSSESDAVLPVNQTADATHKEEVDPPVEATAVKPAEAATPTSREELKIKYRLGQCERWEPGADCEQKVRRQVAFEKALAQDVQKTCVTFETTLTGDPYRSVCKIQVGNYSQMCYMVRQELEYPVECTFYKAIHDRVADLEK